MYVIIIKYKLPCDALHTEYRRWPQLHGGGGHTGSVSGRDQRGANSGQHPRPVIFPPRVRHWPPVRTVLA